MQTFETIVNIPFDEIAELLSEEDYNENCADITSIQVEMTHEVNAASPDTGIYSEYLTYRGFTPVKDYPEEIIDATERFLQSDDSREYHEMAHERYCDYIDYLRYNFN